MPCEAITTCAAATSPAERFAGLIRGDFAATVLQEPWITVAQKAGCQRTMPRGVNAVQGLITMIVIF